MNFGNVNNSAQTRTNPNNMAQLLQNITRVEFIETRYLHNLMLIGNNEVTLQYWRNFTELPIIGLADMEVSESIENGSRLTTVKLTARTACDYPAGAPRRHAWRVTTVTGEQYLIGTTEQPFPVTLVTDSYPGKSTEPSGKTITVVWQSSLGLLEIVG